MPEVYKATNHLQKTRWGNQPLIYEVFDHYWQMDLAVPGLPRRDVEEVPAKPADIDTNEDARKAWRKAARASHDINNRRMQDRLTTAKIHWVCQNYKDLEATSVINSTGVDAHIQSPTSSTHRGNDLVKALLQFADGKRLDTGEAVKWHKIHGANCWGLDKKPFADRVQWVCDNQDAILAVGEDPLENRMWMEAAEPWQFLAWCDDFYRWIHDPENHESKIVVHQDATQSGIQIYSLLLRDREGARNTNVIASPEPQDLPSGVRRRPTSSWLPTRNPIAKKWLDFGIDRACCKRPVMTESTTRPSSVRVYIGDWAGDANKTIPVMDDPEKSSVWFLTSRSGTPRTS